MTFELVLKLEEVGSLVFDYKQNNSSNRLRGPHSQTMKRVTNKIPMKLLTISFPPSSWPVTVSFNTVCE